TRAYKHRDRLTEIERYQTEAYYYFVVDFDPEKQISAYRAILELKPDDPIAPNNLAIALASRRRWGEAQTVIGRWIDRDHGGGNGYVTLMATLLAQGEYDSARVRLDEFARRDSGNILIPRLKYAYYIARGMLDSAHVAMRTYAAHATDPSDRALLLRIQGATALYEGRASDFEQSFRLFMEEADRRALPGDYLLAAAVIARGRIVYRHDTPGGLKVIDEALARHPLSSMAPADRPYGPLITVYALAGQGDKARGLLKEFQTQVPPGLRRGSIDAHASEGFVSLMEGNPDQAISSFRQAYDEDNCTVCLQANLGQAFDMAKQPDSALAAYKRAVDAPKALGSMMFAPFDEPGALQRVGELYEAKGDKANALAYYGRFTRLWANADPELQPAVKDVKARMARLAGEPK
ncbi:MAG TPA: tetratricopeptide repeat protein, partial [Gemmatimonadales bacterium]|nr:tetratricopeptide repeat protein [Gemmatimonadales bacterium]